MKWGNLSGMYNARGIQNSGCSRCNDVNLYGGGGEDGASKASAGVSRQDPQADQHFKLRPLEYLESKRGWAISVLRRPDSDP